jgi:pimeloyl-ACP methyl ester carboxylesterase
MSKHRPVAPLLPGWVVVDGLPMYHRYSLDAPADAPAVVHVHGFGISGTYLERTAALLAPRYRTYVPDLPGMGRSMRPEKTHDLPGLARALIGYCDAVGVDRATFVGNSLGCPIIIELTSSFPDRIERAVLVSPAGGPDTQPMGRAIRRMIADAPREPIGLLPIAVGDYLRFGLLQGWSLFKSMTAYPTLERLRNLIVPTLVVAGLRDPLVRIERVHVFSRLPHVDAVGVTGAHALNFSHPELIAGLIEAFMEGRPYGAPAGSTDSVVVLELPPEQANV